MYRTFFHVQASGWVDPQARTVQVRVQENPQLQFFPGAGTYVGLGQNPATWAANLVVDVLYAVIDPRVRLS